jgi:hypothetical protein
MAMLKEGMSLYCVNWRGHVLLSQASAAYTTADLGKYHCCLPWFNHFFLFGTQKFK